ncbi:MAG: GNAT family N-acetyltransferase [Bacteroidales bacterium]|nr:GNAT family N-acetyltransferase [Bacteroidales bacterium]
MYQVIRATELFQQAGAYYVRIQGMARQHNIALREEFDEYDTPNTKYIVITDNEFPVATCRILHKSDSVAEIGRVVVLDEYRNKGLGRLTVSSAEKWIRELGYKTISIESRDVAVDFYTKLGYISDGTPLHNTGTFTCLHMEKNL